MEKLNTEDGQLFIKNLARFVRTHEKALANALQMRRKPSIDSKASQSNSVSHGSSTSSLAAALSFGGLSFSSHSIKPAKLTLTPHHLFYLLSRFEDLSISVGPMNIRLENINTEASVAYVSFLKKPQRSKTDRDSIHSVSSVRSVMSTMSAFWASFGLGFKDSESRSEKAKAALEADLKYLYSAFTKIPCLRLAPDHKARLIRGYEEFPFDTAVPLHSFKNLGALEIIDIDFRSFFGWDRMADQLRTLTLKRAHIDDPADLLTKIVLDDIDKRRRRSSKSQPSPVIAWSSSSSSPTLSRSVPARSISAPGSPIVDPGFVSSLSSQGGTSMVRSGSENAKGHGRTSSISPTRPGTSKRVAYRHTRGSSSKLKRSGSGSSNSSEASSAHNSISNLSGSGELPPSKWRFLRHLGLPDNSLTSISASSLAPVASTLHSLDLSWNLFTEVPDSLASLVALRSLNLSHCMIDSLHSLSKNPLPAITALNLRGNRLRSIAGIERLLSLERLDLRDNNIQDPTEIARLTAIPYIREIWVSGNPFTKTYSGYRVTLFNLFRKTPGFSEDVIIDSSGPGYSEKKQLVERAVEPEGVPVVRATEEETVTAEVAPPSHVESSYTGEERLRKHGAVATSTHENVVSSGRRKKTHRRRVIDLTQDEFTFTQTCVDDEMKKPVVQQPIADPFVDAAPTDDSTPQNKLNHALSNDESKTEPTKDYPKADGATQQNLTSSVERRDWDVGGDIYRRRLEALKQEVGTNWLTVLGEDTWDSDPRTFSSHPSVSDLDPSGAIRPTALPSRNTASQVIATGGRTLG
ncbi:hypothetical protein VTO42DRAFT_2537 [Malbranchea cinnamomea]